MSSNRRTSDLNVVCPYCGNEYQPEASSYSEENRLETCDECENDYIRYDDWSITHHTRQLSDEDMPPDMDPINDPLNMNS